jgi:hypothetical protein
MSDWFENPITEEFFKVVQVAIDDLHEDKRNAYVFDDASATQNRFSWLLGAEWALNTLMEFKEQGVLPEVRDEQ